MFRGGLLLDKPEGPTSHDIVGAVRRILQMKKVGHAGTLDPFATGLLIVLLGDGTRLARYVTEDDKEYEAVCRWGTAMDTGDPTGRVIAQTEAPCPDADRIRSAMQTLLGPQMQTPPAFSAKKVQGRKMYELARRGEEVERHPVSVRIEALELLSREESEFSFRVRCGKGTYVRVLAEDLCRRLDGLGHLCALRRTGSGPFRIEDAISLDRLSGLAAEKSAETAILSIEQLCSRFPAAVVGGRAAEVLRFGAAPGLADLEASESFRPGDAVRICDSANNLLCLAVARVGSEEGDRGMDGEKAFKIEVNFSAMPS